MLFPDILPATISHKLSTDDAVTHELKVGLVDSEYMLDLGELSQSNEVLGLLSFLTRSIFMCHELTIKSLISLEPFGANKRYIDNSGFKQDPANSTMYLVTNNTEDNEIIKNKRRLGFILTKL